MYESIREMSKRAAGKDRERKSQLISMRRQIPWTQAELAEAMGTSERWVRKFEQYDSDPRMSHVRRYETIVTWALRGMR